MGKEKQAQVRMREVRMGIGMKKKGILPSSSCSSSKPLSQGWAGIPVWRRMPKTKPLKITSLLPSPWSTLQPASLSQKKTKTKNSKQPTTTQNVSTTCQAWSTCFVPCPAQGLCTHCLIHLPQPSHVICWPTRNSKPWETKRFAQNLIVQVAQEGCLTPKPQHLISRWWNCHSSLSEHKVWFRRRGDLSPGTGATERTAT